MRKKIVQKNVSEESTRTAILIAATEEFAMHSLDGASTRMISSRSKTNRALLYYHFTDKENLYAECIKYVISHYEAELAPSLRKSMHSSHRKTIQKVRRQNF